MRRLFPIALLLFLSACKFDGSPTPGCAYLVFGHFYGECEGEQCIELFKLEECKLYEDQKDELDRSGPPNANWKQLSEAQYALVSGLPAEIPRQLLDEPETVIGQPDAGDWGGLYIEVRYLGETLHWYVGKKRDNLPAYLHPMADAVEEAVEALQ